MRTLNYHWTDEGIEHELLLIHVPGTKGMPYLFGSREPHRRIQFCDFHIGSTPVTQALWTYIMGSNPAKQLGPRRPVENVSWEHITGPGGFLDRINDSPILSAVAGSANRARFRLPSETEWEYAARGGPYWTDGFVFSGSNDVNAVAWYGPKWSGPLSWSRWRSVNWRRRVLKRLFGPLVHRETHTHDVARKAPNQLGIYDMSGNVWEWCQDTCVDDLDAIPTDGKPHLAPAEERRLRGGCHHNWDIHCTVWWRYGITPDAHDGCIGFRLVLA